MCIFYIMPLIYTKILLCINGEALFFNRIYLRWYTQHYPISLKFAQIFFNGTAKEEYRHLLDLVLINHCCTDRCYR
jgi:hypothetical protein